MKTYKYYKPFLKKLIPLLQKRKYQDNRGIYEKEFLTPHGIYTVRVSVLPYQIQERNLKGFVSLLDKIKKELKLAVDENGKLLSLGRIPEKETIFIEVFQYRKASAFQMGDEFHIGEKLPVPIRYIYDASNRIWEREEKIGECKQYFPVGRAV